MSDLFEEDEEALMETEEVFDGLEVEPDTTEISTDNNLDARRRLENMLEEKRLRDELDDFVDY